MCWHTAIPPWLDSFGKQILLTAYTLPPRTPGFNGTLAVTMVIVSSTVWWSSAAPASCGRIHIYIYPISHRTAQLLIFQVGLSVWTSTMTSPKKQTATRTPPPPPPTTTTTTRTTTRRQTCAFSPPSTSFGVPSPSSTFQGFMAWCSKSVRLSWCHWWWPTMWRHMCQGLNSLYWG